MGTVIYVRISEDKTGLEAGVNRQEEDCLALCQRMGWEVEQTFRENDTSAYRGKRRPQFEAMVESNPSRVVMWSVDRLVRRGPDLERLISLDIPVHSVMAGPMDLATASGRLNARLLTSVAQFESELKGERQSRALLQRAEEGRAWWTVRPFGYNPDRTIRESEAKHLRWAYAEVLAGGTLRSIARRLNAVKVSTSKGCEWNGNRLRAVLLAHRNAGIRTYRGKEIGPGDWEGIVPVETYRAAVAILTDPARRTSPSGTGRKNLLSGLVVCGKCGAKVTVNAVRPSAARPDRLNYYVCRNRCVAHPQEQMDEYVQGLVLGLLATPAGAALWAPQDEQADLGAIHAEIDRLRALLDALMAERVAGDITADEYQAGATPTRQRKAALEREAEQAAAARTVGKTRLTAEQVCDKWDDLDLDLKRFAIDLILGKIEAIPRGRGNRSPWGPESLEIERARRTPLRLVT